MLVFVSIFRTKLSSVDLKFKKVDKENKTNHQQKNREVNQARRLWNFLKNAGQD